jgi:hypothetical protein
VPVPSNSMRGERYSARGASSLIKAVLRYFLLSSQKMVATPASGPSFTWALTGARKLRPEEMSTASPSENASFRAHGHNNLPAFGELDRISDQVQEHLPDAARIADELIGNPGGGVERKLQTFLLRADGARLQDRLQALAQRE